MSVFETSPSERRAHDRRPIKTDALLGLPGQRTAAARLLDIGKGGAGVVSDYNLPVGTRVTIQARLPARGRGSGVFEAGAVVRNCTLAASDGGFRLGLEFEALSAPATAALGDFLG